MLNRFVVVVIAAGMLLAAAPEVRAAVEVKEVTVTGAGMSRDEAIRDAMRKAVERAAGTVIYSHSESKDFALVKDTILARATGFIQSHKIISAKEMGDGTWEAKITAVVSVKGVADMWGTVTNMLKQMGRPKIMVFVSEKILERGTLKVESSTVQTRIENILLKSGFQLVNKEQIKAIDQKDMAAAVASDNAAKLQAVAQRFGAQLFISGVATATAGEHKRVSGIPLYVYQSEANIKCYRSDTGQLLSSIPGQSTRGVNRVWRSAANMALDLQAKHIAPKVQMDILQFWQDALSGRGEVVLEVENVSFKQYMAIKKALKTLDKVKDVTTKYSNKVARCSIESDVNAETLAEAIVEAMETLEITDVSQNVIKATMAE